MDKQNKGRGNRERPKTREGREVGHISNGRIPPGGCKTEIPNQVHGVASLLLPVMLDNGETEACDRSDRSSTWSPG
jgi:hypothetical protein